MFNHSILTNTAHMTWFSKRFIIHSPHHISYFLLSLISCDFLWFRFHSNFSPFFCWFDSYFFTFSLYIFVIDPFWFVVFYFSQSPTDIVNKSQLLQQLENWREKREKRRIKKKTTTTNTPTKCNNASNLEKKKWPIVKIRHEYRY